MCDFLLCKGDILEKPFQVYLKPIIHKQCGNGDNKKSLGIESTWGFFLLKVSIELFYLVDGYGIGYFIGYD